MMITSIREVFRQLSRGRLSTSINLLGFTLSTAVCLTIYLFAFKELTVDRTFNHTDSYRVIRQISDANQTISTPKIASPFRDAFSLEFGDLVNQVVRVYKSDELVRYGNDTFIEDNFFYVDKGFFEIWNYPFVAGNANHSLTVPNSVVISKSMAAKYFKDAHPIGEVLFLENSQLTVSGIIDTDRYPSHLKFDFVANIERLNKFSFVKDWDAHTMNIYLQANKTASEEELRLMLQQAFRKYKADASSGSTVFLQPFGEIYFDQSTQFDDAAHGQKLMIFAFVGIGVLVILLVLSNFINLAIAQFNFKLHSVGLKKILGVVNGQLIVSVIFESALIVLPATFIGGLLCFILCRAIDDIYSINVSMFLSWSTLGIIGMFSSSIILISAIYPALVIYRIDPINALHGQFKTGQLAGKFRKGLLLFQFFCTTVLIIVCVTIYQQMKFVQKKELGFVKDQVLVFHSNNRGVYKNKEHIKQQLLHVPGVKMAGLTYGGVPGDTHPILTFRTGNSEEFQWYTALIDENFQELLDIRYVAIDSAWTNGRAYYDQAVFLNETAIKRLGWEARQSLGMAIDVLEKGIQQKRRVVGIVKDYHFQSLKKPIEPLALIPKTDWAETFVVKLNTSDLNKTLTAIEQIWLNNAPKYPFTFQFLDDHYDATYRTETQQLKLLIFLTGLLVVLACLGLIGISSLFIFQRRKELGVRKILGASLANLTLILSREFLMVIVVSGLIAYPVAFLISSVWLQNFAFRISINPVLYVGASLFLLAISLLIVLLKSIMSGVTNPLTSLRDE